METGVDTVMAIDDQNKEVKISEAPYWFIDERAGNVTLEFHSDGNTAEAGFFVKEVQVCRVFQYSWNTGQVS